MLLPSGVDAVFVIKIDFLRTLEGSTSGAILPQNEIAQFWDLTCCLIHPLCFWKILWTLIKIVFYFYLLMIMDVQGILWKPGVTQFWLSLPMQPT